MQFILRWCWCSTTIRLWAYQLFYCFFLDAKGWHQQTIVILLPMRIMDGVPKSNRQFTKCHSFNDEDAYAGDYENALSFQCCCCPQQSLLITVWCLTSKYWLAILYWWWCWCWCWHSMQVSLVINGHHVHYRCMLI